MKSGAGLDEVHIEIEARDSYRIMWLAGIREVDLTQHCLKTFGESDRAQVSSRPRRQSLRLPAVNPPVAWYLCALPIPWNWARNAHLAFEHAPGRTWEGNALVSGLGVRLTNARPILDWGEHSIPTNAPRRTSRLYRTCRNWQFAWWLRMNRSIPETFHSPETDVDEEGPQQLQFP